MPSSWNVYYVFFQSAVLALAIPAVLALISRMISPVAAKKRLRREVLDEVSDRNETLLGQRINARFFLGVNAALVLIALMLILIPFAGQLHGSMEPESTFRVLVAIVSIAGFAILGLLYSIRKSDLSWLTRYQKKPEGPSR